MASTGILVAGMHRSGTSATAGALSHFGIALGSRLLAPGPDNPRGYWEHERAVEIHDALLAALDRRWDDVRALPPEWRDSSAASEARAAIEELVATDFATSGVWAVKDPRICRFLPLWRDVLDGRGIRPVVMFVVRHPLEVAASLEKRNGWAPSAGVLLWLRHVIDASADSRGLTRSVLAYAELIEDPPRAVSNALAGLGVDALAHGSTALREFVDPVFRHHAAPAANTVGLSRFLDLSLAAYEALLDTRRRDDSWDRLGEIATEFESLWRARGDELDALAGMASARASSADRLRIRMAHSDAALSAQIAWSEDAAHRMDVAQGEREEERSLLAAQIKWSEQAAAKIEVVQAERDEMRSQLIAQIKWSEGAAARIEAVQAERDEARSQLIAQIKWSEDAAAKLDAVQAERDEARSQLTAQIRWSEDAVAIHRQVVEERELNARELERTGVALQDAVARSEQLEANLSATQARVRQLTDDLDATRERLLTAEHQLELSVAELDALYRSRSWRLTRPFRTLAARWPAR